MQAHEKVQASLWKTYRRAREIPLWSRALLQHGSISNQIPFTKPGTMKFSSTLFQATLVLGITVILLLPPQAQVLELVSKELNHLAAILHVYAGILILMK